MTEHDMTLIDKNLTKEIKTKCNTDGILTKYNVAESSRDFFNCKQFIFEGFGPFFESASDVIQNIPIPTSLDYIFGEPILKGETISIEGYSNTGKTRLCTKLATEIAQTAHVLFLDSDFNLTPQVFGGILSSFGDSYRPDTYYNIDEPPSSSGSLHIISILNAPDVFEIISRYTMHTCPDLIIIDSLLSLFQNVVGKDNPGTVLLEELAIELKSLAATKSCAIVVTNSTKKSEGNQPTFLGPQYGSLWHVRVQLSTKNNVTATATLLGSPRIKQQAVLFQLTDLEQCADVQPVQVEDNE